MKVGFSKAIITPKLPVKLAGYAVERIANEVHDDLYVRVLSFDQDGKRKAILSLEILALDDFYLNQLKDSCKVEGLEDVEIEAFAIHTHSGPMGTCDCASGPLAGFESVLGDPNQEYVDYLCKQSIKAMKQAFHTQDEGTLSISEGMIQGVGKNRHLLSGSQDESLLVMNFIRKDGKTCILYHFACHPTLLHEDSLLISADIIGAINAKLETNQVMPIFINGSCGDISTRFTRMNSDLSELDRYASITQQAIIETNKQVAYLGEIKSIQFDHYTFSLKLKDNESVEATLAKLNQCRTDVETAKLNHLNNKELRLIESSYEGATIAYLHALHPFVKDQWDINLSIIRINDEYKFITIPGELFCGLSNPIKQLKKTYFFGYANGYYDYIADEDAYHNNYYEAMCSPFKQGEGERLMELVKKVL
ncbi:MAG: neutral/alkaline non-lysosomal ceramidase N-terminal domain-containing protein [Erysipelotrichaceae bacterium]